MTARSPEQVVAMWQEITGSTLSSRRRRDFLRKLKRYGMLRQLPDDELKRLGHELFEQTNALRLDAWAALALRRYRQLTPSQREVREPVDDRATRPKPRKRSASRDPSMNPSYRNEDSIQKRIPSGSGRPSQSDEPPPLNRDKQPKGPRYVKRFSGGAPVYPEKSDRELHRRIGNINDHDG